MLILGIDTSGRNAACALCTEEALLAETTIFTELTHSQVILPLCKQLAESAGVELSELDGIAVSAGPGSYTGLRIGISAVKAMGMALEKPCAGISTLESLAYNLSCFDGVIIPVMKARENLVYTAFFNAEGGEITRMEDDMIISAEDLAVSVTGIRKGILVGDAAAALYADEKLSPFKKLCIAPPPLRLQRASSLCYAAMKNGFSTPEALEASYLQPTKAEKDRTESEN